MQPCRLPQTVNPHRKTHPVTICWPPQKLDLGWLAVSLGYVDLEEKSVQPLQNPVGPKL